AGYAEGASPRQFALARYNSGTVVGTVEAETGIPAIRLSPNPARAGGQLALQLTPDAAGPLRLQLLGADGRLLHTFAEQSMVAGEQTLQVELPAGLPAGEHWLRLETRQGAGALPVVVVQ
ncbi:MAG: hypothetical protein IT260_14370, partial [Saprospiraceae bacterium]|nr:hypothetical protein [Saprospiraceae bacterium]